MMQSQRRRIKKSKTKGETAFVKCPKCNSSTKHKIVESYLERYDDDEHGIWGETDYQIVECQGCETVSFRSVDIFSEDLDYDDEGNYCAPETVKLYPERQENTLVAKELPEVPFKLRQIYDETIECFNRNMSTLCAAGLRAIIEGICVEKNIESGKGSSKNSLKPKKNLDGKITGLSEAGILTDLNANILHQLRFLGNEALHQLVSPSKDELKDAIEIVEHIFESIYRIPVRGEALKIKREERTKKKST